MSASPLDQRTHVALELFKLRYMIVLPSGKDSVKKLADDCFDDADTFLGSANSDGQDDAPMPFLAP